MRVQVGQYPLIVIRRGGWEEGVVFLRTGENGLIVLVVPSRSDPSRSEDWVWNSKDKRVQNTQKKGRNYVRGWRRVGLLYPCCTKTIRKTKESKTKKVRNYVKGWWRVGLLYPCCTCAEQRVGSTSGRTIIPSHYVGARKYFWMNEGGPTHPTLEVNKVNIWVTSRLRVFREETGSTWRVELIKYPMVSTPTVQRYLWKRDDWKKGGYFSI